MKLAKLSLAAIVAAGALTTVNAQPLEEAIKGVDFSGMLRYRNNQQWSGSDKTSNKNDWDFLAKFTAPVTDDIKAVMAFASNSTNVDNQNSNGVGVENVDLAKAYFVYSQDALTVSAGKQALGHPIFDNGFNGNKANGVLATYNLGAVTLAGAYYTGIGGPGTNVITDLQGLIPAIPDAGAVSTVAAIGSFGPVNGQIWLAQIENVVDSQVFVQLDAKFSMVSLTAQYINTKLGDGVMNVLGAGAEDNGQFFGIEATGTLDMFSLTAGYNKNDKDQGVNSIAGGDSSVLTSNSGWKLPYEISNMADAEVYYATAGVTYGKYGAKLGYAHAEADVSDDKADETWGEISYSVSKNLNTYVKYSDMGKDLDKDYFRFEAKYSF